MAVETQQVVVTALFLIINDVSSAALQTDLKKALEHLNFAKKGLEVLIETVSKLEEAVEEAKTPQNLPKITNTSKLN